MFLLTKYVLSAEEVGSLKYAVQSPLEFGWDVKEQRPGRERRHLRCAYLGTTHALYSTVSSYFANMTDYSESQTFPANWLQKLPKPWRDSSHGVTGVSSLRQQEGQVEVEALLRLDVPSFAPNQVICRGLRGRHYSIDQILQRG